MKACIDLNRSFALGAFHTERQSSPTFPLIQPCLSIYAPYLYTARSVHHTAALLGDHHPHCSFVRGCPSSAIADYYPFLFLFFPPFAFLLFTSVSISHVIDISPSCRGRRDKQVFNMHYLLYFPILLFSPGLVVLVGVSPTLSLCVCA